MSAGAADGQWRTTALAVVIALTLVLSAVTGWAQEIKYAIPRGFLNLSPGAPAGNFAKVSAVVVEQARPFHGYAVLLENDTPTVVFSVAVKESDLGVMELADGIAAAVPQRQDYSGARILTQEKVRINGFECAKVEFVGTVEGQEFSKLSYVLPIGSARALMSLDGTPQDLARVRDAFESSVRSASGLVHPTDPRQPAKIGIAVGVVLLVVTALMQRSRNKRKRPVGQQPGETASEKAGLPK